MKQKPDQPNAGKNIKHSFSKVLQKTEPTSDKIRDPDSSG
jgi:hypothetical protein